MISIRAIALSAATLPRRIVSILRGFAQSRLAQVRDRRLLSMMNERELRELGVSRNQDNDSYYHRD